jgi:diacylglycerol kinase (ATP)
LPAAGACIIAAMKRDAPVANDSAQNAAKSAGNNAAAPHDSRSLKGKRGIQRVLNAARYSIDGLASAWVGEDAFRQEVALAVVMIPVALFLQVALVEKILLIGAVLQVLVVELLNTAVEAAVDRDSYRIDSLGKRAKDIGSAAVMLSLLFAGGTWAAILIQHFSG